MNDVARGALVGAGVAVAVLALFLESAGLLFPPPPPPAFTAVRIGPDGAGNTPFAEGLVDAPVPGSAGYAFCVGDLTVKRPSMITTNMPDSFCSVRRGADGQWLVSTGGWQECRLVCAGFAPAKP